MLGNQLLSILCELSLVENVGRAPFYYLLLFSKYLDGFYYFILLAKAVRTGALPGVTRSVEGVVRVFDEPKTYLIDTPGVMVPNVKDIEVGMKLALIGSVKDDVVGIQVIADFLLKTFNKRGFTG
jgi:hypothetical protein